MKKLLLTTAICLLPFSANANSINWTVAQTGYWVELVHEMDSLLEAVGETEANRSAMFDYLVEEMYDGIYDKGAQSVIDTVNAVEEITDTPDFNITTPTLNTTTTLTSDINIDTTLNSFSGTNLTAVYQQQQTLLSNTTFIFKSDVNNRNETLYFSRGINSQNQEVFALWRKENSNWRLQHTYYNTTAIASATFFINQYNMSDFDYYQNSYYLNNSYHQGYTTSTTIAENTITSYFDSHDVVLSNTMLTDLNTLINDVAEKAYTAGYSNGYENGYEAGYADGFRDGVQSVKDAVN